jgi:DNA-binding transcriptional LysR family regulator
MTHNSNKFDWNDLKYFLAVARHGSTLAAGRALEVDQSTVQRRLAELERRIGRPLAQRHPTGYRLTEFGNEMLPHAQRIEDAMSSFEQHLVASGRELVGVVRVTCPEPLMTRLTQSSLIDRFHARYPTLQVQFVMSDKYLDLSKGDADIALRSGDTDDDALVGRKVGESVWAVYASQKYIDQHGQPCQMEELEQHPLIGFDDSMAKHRTAEWLRSVAPNAKIVVRNSSVLGLVNAAKSGVGLAPLPIALGSAEPDLVRVLGPVDALTRTWRVLTTPELRRTPRVSAFFDFIVEEIPALRPVFGG